MLALSNPLSSRKREGIAVIRLRVEYLKLKGKRVKGVTFKARFNEFFEERALDEDITIR